MRQKTDGLTTKQKEVLDFIKQFHADNKYPPSIRQICSAINLSSPATVHVHINHLVDKGYIKRSKEGNKALELLVPNEYETKGEDVVNVPLLGKITAGSPIEAIEVPNEFFTLPSYLIPKQKEVFTLKVDGESMINKGIFSNCECPMITASHSPVAIREQKVFRLLFSKSLFVVTRMFALG